MSSHPPFPHPVPHVHACGERRSLGWNYLTGTVPVPGTVLQVLDLENNWFIGKFPSTTNWYFCTARANCFNDPTPCKNNNNQGITQRPSCAICNSADGTGTLCGGIVPCQPDPAAVKAATAFPTTSTPVLALTCPPVPPVTTDATAGTIAVVPHFAATVLLLLAHASPHHVHAMPLISPHHVHAMPLISPHHVLAMPLISPHHVHAMPLISPHHVLAMPVISPHHVHAMPLISPHDVHAHASQHCHPCPTAPRHQHRH
ncbi:unnamed protein product [Closterium sp. NIES-54]